MLSLKGSEKINSEPLFFALLTLFSIQDKMAISRQKKLLLPVFFLSGFAALIYEVIWARMLTLVFGSTVEAVSAVVAAFMAGLAMGSYFMGKWADRRSNTLFIYSITELCIGIASLSLYFIILFIPDMYSSFHETININNNLTLFHGGTYILEFILIFVPTTLMGATFPLMVKSYVTSRNYVGEGMSVIYTINTLGAVFGTFFTGFLLIPWLGIRATVFIAVSINILLAAASILINRFQSPPFSDPVPSSALSSASHLARPIESSHHILPSPSVAFSVLLVLCLSGFASLAYQVAWTRVLTLVIGNSVYAFTTILTTFLIGISLGSFAFIRRIDGVKDKILLLGILQLLLCFSVVGMLPMMDSLPALFLALFRSLPTNFIGTVFIEFVVTFTVILVPAILMGATFPVAARIYVGMVDNIGEGLGRLYSANTVGAIFGSFLTGFVFIPALGLQNTILFISTLNLFSSVLLVGQAKMFGKAWRVAVSAISIFLFIYYATTIHTWNRNIMNRGVYLYAEWLKKLPDTGGGLAEFSDEFKLLFYEEGRGGTVAVTRTQNALSLQINGKSDAGTNSEDMVTQTMLSVLPLLAHPNPGELAIIGLGSGVSLGAAERFPVKKIDCIEILPEVVKANRYFSKFNHNALDDSRANMIIADGRQHLSTNKKRYDIVISEPSNPWITGVSNLFTMEFFKISKESLKEGGIMCQWIHLYAIDTAELKTLLNTFRTIFPQVTVWAFSPNDLIILGSRQPIKLDNDRLRMAFSTHAIKEELLRIGITRQEEIESAHLMGNKEVNRFCRRARLNTDDRPIIEFEAPKALYRPTVNQNIQSIKLSIKQ